MMKKTTSQTLSKEVWEGWTVGAFIEDLQPQLDMIMKGKANTPPLESRLELKRWLCDNQPYYKKHIPEVYDYFCKRYML